jgi:Zn finger protein HypA/HybF involved in hydrogenase expression
MKNCPNCNSEIEESFELCWNCNFSLTENRIVEIKDMTLKEGNREVDCLRCKIQLIFSGRFDFHEGPRIGALGNLFELFVNKEKFDLYMCPKCGKVEFFIPLNDSELKLKDINC